MDAHGVDLGRDAVDALLEHDPEEKAEQAVHDHGRQDLEDALGVAVVRDADGDEHGHHGRDVHEGRDAPLRVVEAVGVDHEGQQQGHEQRPEERAEGEHASGDSVLEHDAQQRPEGEQAQADRRVADGEREDRHVGATMLVGVGEEEMTAGDDDEGDARVGQDDQQRGEARGRRGARPEVRKVEAPQRTRRARR